MTAPDATQKSTDSENWATDRLSRCVPWVSLEVHMVTEEAGHESVSLCCWSYCWATKEMAIASLYQNQSLSPKPSLNYAGNSCHFRRPRVVAMASAAGFHRINQL